MKPVDRHRILSRLGTSELIDLAQHFGLPAQSSMERETIVDLLTTTERVTMGQMLMSMSRRRLKELCRALGLDDSGREKMLIVTRLLGIDPMRPPEPRAVPPIRRRRKPT